MAGHFWRFQLPAALLTAVFAVAGALLPTDARPLLRAGTAMLSVFGGILLIGLLAFFASLVLAPIRQRDEARAKVTALDAPATDRVALLRSAYQNGRRCQARVAHMDDYKKRCDTACRWAKEAWLVVSQHFPGFEEPFYGEKVDPFGGSLFWLSCSREVDRLGPDRYVESKVAMLGELLRKYDTAG